MLLVVLLCMPALLAALNDDLDRYTSLRQQARNVSLSPGERLAFSCDISSKICVWPAGSEGPQYADVYIDQPLHVVCESSERSWAYFAIKDDAELTNNATVEIFDALVPSAILIYCPQPNPDPSFHTTCSTNMTTGVPVFLERQELEGNALAEISESLQNLEQFLNLISSPESGNTTLAEISERLGELESSLADVHTLTKINTGILCLLIIAFLLNYACIVYCHRKSRRIIQGQTTTQERIDSD